MRSLLLSLRLAIRGFAVTGNAKRLKWASGPGLKENYLAEHVPRPRSCFCVTYSLCPSIVRDLASTTYQFAVVQRRVPGIRHSAIYVIPGFRQVRISVIVPSSRKLGTRIFRNRPRGGSAGIRILYTYVTSSGDIRYDNRSYAVLVQR